MKPEWIAAGILTVILGLSVWNALFLRGLTEELDAAVEEAGDAARDGIWDSAEEAVDLALSLWEERSGYTHTVMIHAEQERLTEALYLLRTAIRNRERGTALGTAEYCQELLLHLRQSEAPRPDSIL